MAANAHENRKLQLEHQQQQRREDIISGLPDDILGEILSSMPTKDAVKTSSLSKRWKSVWTYVSAVRIRDGDWFETKKDGFVNFVERVLDHLVVPVQKLELDCGDANAKHLIHILTGGPDLEELVFAGTMYDYDASLDEVDLALLCVRSFTDQLSKLPPSLFTSKKLVVLKLHINAGVSSSWSPSIGPTTKAVVSLPCLKVLHLRTSKDICLVGNILTGCPVLKELFLAGIMLNEFNKESLCVKSSSLKSFKLYCSEIINSRIEIDASNLEELDLHFNPRYQIAIVNTNLPLLTRLTLHISIDRSIDRSPNPEISVYRNRLIDLLTKVPDTKYLFLYSDAMMCLLYGGVFPQLPMFKNLMDLNLDVSSNTWPLLHCFLESSPNLVSFSIRRVSVSVYEWHSLTPTPNWPMMKNLHHLEKVELKNIRGSDDEMDLVSYLLKKALLLKEMTIIFASRLTSKEASQLHSRIVKFPKASTACKVIYHIAKDNKF